MSPRPAGAADKVWRGGESGRTVTFFPPPSPEWSWEIIFCSIFPPLLFLSFSTAWPSWGLGRVSRAPEMWTGSFLQKNDRRLPLGLPAVLWNDPRWIWIAIVEHKYGSVARRLLIRIFKLPYPHEVKDKSSPLIRATACLPASPLTGDECVSSLEASRGFVTIRTKYRYLPKIFFSMQITRYHQLMLKTKTKNKNKKTKNRLNKTGLLLLLPTGVCTGSSLTLAADFQLLT